MEFAYGTSGSDRLPGAALDFHVAPFGSVTEQLVAVAAAGLTAVEVA